MSATTDPNRCIHTHVMLRGGRMTKLGKQVASYAPMIGLVGAAAMFGASDASAQSVCAFNISGDILCDVTTYTPGTDGDGTTETPGTVALRNTNWTLTSDTTVTVDNLVMNTEGNAVVLWLSAASTPGVATSFVFQGATQISSGPLALRLESAANPESRGHSAVFKDSARVVSTGSRALDLRMNSTGSTGDLALTLNGTSSLQGAAQTYLQLRNGVSGDAIATLNDGSSITGASGIRVEFNSSSNTTGSAKIVMNNDSFVETTGAALEAFRFGTSESGNADITLNDQSRVMTTSNGATGARTFTNQSSAANFLITLNDKSSIETKGVAALGALAQQSGLAGTGDAIVSLNDTASITTAGHSADGAQASQLGVGDAIVNVSGAATVTTSGDLASSVYATISARPGGNLLDADGNEVLRPVLDDAGNPTGAFAPIPIALANPGGGNAIIRMTGGTVVNTGSESFGLRATSASAVGNADIVVDGGNVDTVPTTITSTGAGVTAISAMIGQPTTVARDGEGNPLFTTRRDAEGKILTDTAGNALVDLVMIAAPARMADAEGNPIDLTGSALVRVCNAIVSASGTGATGVQAITTSTAGSTDVRLGVDAEGNPCANPGTLTVAGTGSTAVEAGIEMPQKPVLDAEGNAVFETVLDADGNPVLRADGSVLTRPVTEDDPAALVDANGDPLVLTGNVDVNVGNFAVTATGDNAIGLDVTNPGEGDTTITVADGGSVMTEGTGAIAIDTTITGNGDLAISVEGDVASTGENAIGIDLENSGNGNSTITVADGGSVKADGTGSTAIDTTVTGSGDLAINVDGDVIATGEDSIGIDLDMSAATGTFDINVEDGTVGGKAASINLVTAEGVTGDINVGQDGTIGTSGDLAAIQHSGAGIVDVANAGTILGGVDVSGDFANTATGTVTITGEQNFAAGGDLINDGLIDAADGATGGTISVGGDLGGSGTIKLDTDFAKGTTDSITVGGNVLAGSSVNVDVNNLGGTIDDASQSLLSKILNVDGTVADDATYTINAGFLEFQFDIVNGVLSAPKIAVAEEVQVYTAAPVSIASMFTRIGSLHSRLAGRSYTRNDTRTVDGSDLTTQTAMAPVDSATSEVIGRGAWVSVSTEDMKSSRSTGAVHSDTYVELEAGYDVVMDAADGQLVLGGNLHMGQLSTDILSERGTASSLSSTGYGLGATATYYLDTGTYVDASVRRTSATSSISDASGTLASDVNSTSLVGSFELGHNFTLSETARLTPSAQLTLGRTEVDGFTDKSGLVVADSTQSNREARIGVAYEQSFGELNSGNMIRLSADYLRDFSPESETTVSSLGSSTVLSSTGEANWLELGLGTSLNVHDNGHLNFEVSYSFAPEERSLNNGVKASIGYQFQF